MNSREFVYNVLLLIEQQHIFVNDYLKDNRDFESLSSKDQSLAYNIIYGVIQNKLLLDYQVNQFLSNPKRLSIKARIILRMVAYQSIFLDTIPNHANCSSAVNLAKKLKLGKLAGLINAVSRKIVKIKSEDLKLPEEDDTELYLSVKYSHPKWLVSRWIRQRGIEDTIKTLEINNEILPTTVRINPAKISLDEAKRTLVEDNYVIEDVSLTPEIAFNVDKGDIFKTELFKNGKISIQDQGAIKACLLLNPKKREKILDMCSAPGGKTALIGNLTKNECNLFAVDVNKKRLELVEEICKRMGVSAKTIHADATIIKPEDYGFFDKILLDAPCTGLGTIRTKPEVRWYRNEEDIQKVIPLQKKLFYNGLKLLDKNGILVYVTCSNEQEETIGIVKSFEQIEVIDVMQLYPFKFNTEGFFIAVIKRRG